MYTVLVMATQGEPNAGLLQTLDEEGISYSVVSSLVALPGNGARGSLDALLLDLSACDREVVQPVARRCLELGVPVLCGLPPHLLAEYDALWGASDFFILPPSAGEVTARLRQAQGRHNDRPGGEKVLRTGDLYIDLERYEVFNRGRPVLLTYKEYQLLYVLASNSGRVLTRGSLLDQIWGYDYYGGTRTVDVHIRRLRSKLEDTDQSLIETVWNVGYRFRTGDTSAPEA